jgi:hypothetical protein
MKRIVLAVMLAAVLAGCTSRTEFGPCVGIGDDKDPKLTYKLSAWNLALAIVFIGVVIPPILVAVDETFCPVGKK